MNKIDLMIKAQEYQSFKQQSAILLARVKIDAHRFVAHGIFNTTFRVFKKYKILL